MKILLFLSLFSNLILADYPIEGGIEVPKDEKYKTFIRIETPKGYSCSATMVSANKILTAAHCVVGSDFKNLYKIGDDILDYGKVLKLDIHPSYIKSRKLLDEPRSQMNELVSKAGSMTQEQINTLINSADFKKLSKTLETLNSRSSQSDIAFITMDKDFKLASFPKIIDKNDEFLKRGKIQIIGFGTTEKSWNQARQSYKTNRINKQGAMAISNWSKTPTSYKNNSSNKELGTLNYKSTVRHIIYQKKDYQRRSQSMLMPGDSGASAIEIDKSNKLIVTAVASTVLDFVQNESNMTLNVVLPGQKKKPYVFKKGINNWGDPKKSNLSFYEVKNKLRELGLYKNRKLKDGVRLSREFTRETTANFSDLLHPDNQIFIEKVMKGHR